VIPAAFLHTWYGEGKMMANICLGAAGVCLLYYLIIVIYAGITADFAWIWVLGAAALLILGLLMRHERSHPGFIPMWLRVGFLVLFTAGVVVVAVTGSHVIGNMFEEEVSTLDYVVVLGAQVKGDTPSRALRKRLEKALEYANANPETILILSGGQGPGEDITEASCMGTWLEEHGISRDRMILEEQSTSTRENLIFSDELTGCASRSVGILSNNFHVYRALKLAEKLGYTDIHGIPASSDLLMQPHYVVREIFALVKEKLKGNI
jgi:uncharacterized SAM-binding protein YcdF (DUF218 family)